MNIIIAILLTFISLELLFRTNFIKVIRNIFDNIKDIQIQLKNKSISDEKKFSIVVKSSLNLFYLNFQLLLKMIIIASPFIILFIINKQYLFFDFNIFKNFSFYSLLLFLILFYLWIKIKRIWEQTILLLRDCYINLL